MKGLFAEWTFIVIVAIFVFPVLISVQMHAFQSNITGNYALYREGDLNGKSVGYMKISPIQNGQFTISILEF